jgi:hypothetical protein
LLDDISRINSSHMHVTTMDVKQKSVLVLDKKITRTLGLKAFLYKLGLSKIKFASSYSEASLSVIRCRPDIAILEVDTAEELYQFKELFMNLPEFLVPSQIVFSFTEEHESYHILPHAQVHVLQKPYPLERLRSILSYQSVPRPEAVPE